jgi:hypothetical protein
MKMEPKLHEITHSLETLKQGQVDSAERERDAERRIEALTLELARLHERLGKTNGSTPHAVQEDPAKPPRSRAAPQKHPVLDYLPASVLFAASYLAIEPRRRRGAAHLLPFIPTAVAALEAYQAKQAGRDEGAVAATAVSGLTGLGSVLIGTR